MAQLGYACAVQTRAAEAGAEFVLATFYRATKLRVVWRDERSRALLLGLQVLAPGPAQGCVVWVANLHLEGSPYRPNDRVSQLRSALRRLQAQHGAAAPAAHVLLVGDFNSGPTDSPCWLLRRGRLDAHFTDAVCPQAGVVSPCGQRRGRGFPGLAFCPSTPVLGAALPAPPTAAAAPSHARHRCP